MPAKKVDGWKDDLKDLVSEGKTYAQAQAALQEKYGEEEGKVGASTFGKLRKITFPEEKSQDAINEVGEQHNEKKKPKLKPMKVWNAQKQKAGDTSQLADVLNQVIFFAVPCKSGKLELKHVQEINVGGGIVNTVTYLFPTMDIGNNPIVTLLIRVGLLVMKVRKMCDAIRNKGTPHENDVIGAPADGMNPDYEQGEERLIPIADIITQHPTDKFLREEGILDSETRTE